MLFACGADAFLNKGTNGRWRGVLADEEVATYHARAVERLPATLSRGFTAVPTRTEPRLAVPP